jgi:hypothetical protein
MHCPKPERQRGNVFPHFARSRRMCEKITRLKHRGLDAAGGFGIVLGDHVTNVDETVRGLRGELIPAHPCRCSPESLRLSKARSHFLGFEQFSSLGGSVAFIDLLCDLCPVLG